MFAFIGYAVLHVIGSRSVYIVDEKENKMFCVKQNSFMWPLYQIQHLTYKLNKGNGNCRLSLDIAPTR